MGARILMWPDRKLIQEPAYLSFSVVIHIRGLYKKIDEEHIHVIVKHF